MVMHSKHSINIDSISKIRITDKLPINKLIEMVSVSPTDYILIADSSYVLISADDFEIDDDNIVIPSIVPFNSEIAGPFGKQIKNINIESNLKIQPFSSNNDSYCFLPFAFVANKNLILKLLNNVECSLFLEMSLLSIHYNINIKLESKWIVSVIFRQESADTRLKLSVKFGTMYSAIQQYEDYTSKFTFLSDHPNFKLNKYVSKFGGENIILTDHNFSDLDFLSYNNKIVSVDSDVSADYYIAFDEKTLENSDLSRTISQISMPSVKKPFPIDARLYGVSAYFGVKQFSSEILFEPPFTKSTYKILTALEILCFFKPLSITVASNNIIGSLIALGNDQESVKKQIFITKIIEHCSNNNIQLKIIGDLCKLN